MVKSGKPRPVLAIVTTIVWGVLLFPAALLAITSPMIFDSGANRYVWSLFFAALSFPILCVVAIAGSWVAWRTLGAAPAGPRRYVPIVVACLPLLPALYLIIMMIVHPSFQ